MNIYDVLNDTCDNANFSTPEDIRPEVELALQDQFGEYESQWDDVKAKFGDFKTFVNKVIETLLALDCDEAWLDGEVYLQIEGIGQDILDSSDVGSRQKQLENILGTDENDILLRLQSRQ